MELSIEGLSKRFGSKVAVDNISVTLQPGVYGLLGANGAGKTTLRRMVCDILKPTSGKIFYDGKEIEELGETYRNYLGYLPQDFGYYPDFTAKEYLEFIAAVKGLNTAKTKKKVSEILETVNLSDVAGKKIRTFSGGMKQRLGIAQALLADPKLLICDEPTSALDPVGRKEILDILYKIRGTTTVLFSTHILSDVERICDHVALLNDGNIAVGGTLSEIKALHSHDSLLIEFSTEADLQHFKECMTGQSLLNGSEEKGREIVIHSREMKKAQHTIFSTLAEADLVPVKVELMEPSLESLFLEVIK